MAASTMPDRRIVQHREQYEIEKELATRLKTASKEERRVLYNSVYDEMLQRVPDSVRTAEAIGSETGVATTNQVRTLLPFLRRDMVFLEIGPGNCQVVIQIAQHVKQVYAVDVTLERVKDIALPPNLKFVLSDGTSVPVAENSVDLAYSNQVMEHLHQDDAYEQACNIHRALAPGGRFICITPNRLSGPHDISKFFDDVAAGLHLKEYTITELARVFRSAGFRKVNIFVSYMGHVLPLLLPVAPVTWLEALLEKAPRGIRKRVGHWLLAVKIVGTK